MAKTVEVPSVTLKLLLERTREAAHISFAHYDRAKRSYVFTDEMWKAADPHGFSLYARLQRALG